MKDLCLHRLTKTKKQKHDIKNYIILEFLHKNMDKINIKNILLSQQSKEHLPIPTHHIEQTGFTYKYTRRRTTTRLSRLRTGLYSALVLNAIKSFSVHTMVIS